LLSSHIIDSYPVYIFGPLIKVEGMDLIQNLEIAAGKLCEILIPIRHEYYIGTGNNIAICTLSSVDLLQTIADSPDIMDRIIIAGGCSLKIKD
jgi:hypothetical protein